MNAFCNEDTSSFTARSYKEEAGIRVRIDERDRILKLLEEGCLTTSMDRNAKKETSG